VLTIKVLFLLLLANGTPVIVKKLLGSRLAFPLDGGKKFVDGRVFFGHSKTVRGIISTGALFATASLSGDLVSSFIKRRLNIPPSSRALGLDQLPESILPLLFCWQALDLDMPTAMTIVLIFFWGELVLSLILFRLNIRDHPY
jgi:CDP-2,3-bis-(O-geranylgeranyl)-sn-glycerol synthase